MPTRPPPTSDAFKQSIARVEDAGRSYRAVYNLGPLPEFREAARNAHEYIAGCLALLAEEGVPRRRRGVAILTMVQLDLDDRLIFLDGMMTLFNAGKIRDYELGEALSPPPRLSSGLALHSGDQRVVDLLTRVRNDDRLAPYIRDTATRLLSGEAVAELLVADINLMRHGHRPPSLADFGAALGIVTLGSMASHPLPIGGLAVSVLAGLFFWRGRRRKGSRTNGHAKVGDDRP